MVTSSYFQNPKSLEWQVIRSYVKCQRKKRAALTKHMHICSKIKSTSGQVKCSHRSDEKLRVKTTQKWTEKRQPLKKQIQVHLNTNCLINQSPDVKMLLIMLSNKRIRHQNKTGLILVSFLVSFLLSLPRWELIVDDEYWNLSCNVINYKAAGKIIFEM